MKICRNCKATFKEPYLQYPSWSRNAEEAEEQCPECGSTSFTDAYSCPKCGKWYDGDKDFCPDCMDYIAETMRDLFDGLEGCDKANMEFEVRAWMDNHW